HLRPRIGGRETSGDFEPPSRYGQNTTRTNEPLQWRHRRGSPTAGLGTAIRGHRTSRTSLGPRRGERSIFGGIVGGIVEASSSAGPRILNLPDELFKHLWTELEERH